VVSVDYNLNNIECAHNFPACDRQRPGESVTTGKRCDVNVNDVLFLWPENE
jgi:hypothetical protein